MAFSPSLHRRPELSTNYLSARLFQGDYLFHPSGCTFWEAQYVQMHHRKLEEQECKSEKPRCGSVHDDCY